MSYPLYSGLTTAQILAQGVTTIMLVNASGQTIDSLGGSGSSGGSAGVASINGITGTINIVGSTGIGITTGASTITVTYTGIAGDVSGPVSSTNNAVATWNGTAGNDLNNSLVTIDSSGDMNASAGELTLASVTGTVITTAVSSQYNVVKEGEAYTALAITAGTTMLGQDNVVLTNPTGIFVANTITGTNIIGGNISSTGNISSQYWESLGNVWYSTYTGLSTIQTDNTLAILANVITMQTEGGTINLDGNNVNVNGAQVLTTGIFLGSVSGSVAGGIITVSGDYSLPSFIPTLGIGSLTGTTSYFTTVGGNSVTGTSASFNSATIPTLTTNQINLPNSASISGNGNNLMITNNGGSSPILLNEFAGIAGDVALTINNFGTPNTVYSGFTPSNGSGTATIGTLALPFGNGYFTNLNAQDLTVNGVQVLTTGIGLGGITVSESNGIITVSGSSSGGNLVGPSFSPAPNGLAYFSGNSVTQLSESPVFSITGTYGPGDTFLINALAPTGVANIVFSSGQSLGTSLQNELARIDYNPGSSVMQFISTQATSVSANTYLQLSSSGVQIFNFNLGPVAPYVANTITSVFPYSGTAGFFTSLTGTTISTTTITGTSASFISGNFTTGTFGQLVAGTGSAVLFSGNQFATIQASGNTTASTYTINFNSGTSQVLSLFGAPSGVACTITLSGGLPGSTYSLQTINNTTGTSSVAWPTTNMKWAGGLTGTMTQSGTAVDLFTFYYNGLNYLGLPTNNFF